VAQGVAGYRTLDEQEGRLSEAEQRFERRRRTVGLFLGPIVFAAMLLIPFDLDGNQHRLAAILAFVIVWWLTEAIPIPVTALLGVVLCALLEATPPPPEGDSSVDVVFGLCTDVVLISVLVSETTSNTASAAIMVPIAISIGAASDLNPTIPALAAIFGANYGFMLPVSTPPNAIVYSSGLLPITRMLKAGVVFDIIGAVLCVVGVIAMANVVGLA
jgi:di/tricarboxylate transporter